jgi:SAM-dependent methyltransferase
MHTHVTSAPIVLHSALTVAVIGAPAILRARFRESLELYADLRRRAQRARRGRILAVDGIPLPPRKLRVGGPAYRSDSFFLAYADADVARLVDWFGIDEGSRILDIGCGQCRLALGLLRRFQSVRRYCGLDLDPASMEWGRKHIGGKHPEFEFVALDVANERYNPDGRPMDATFRLPYDDASFDLVYMAGVVPHLLPEDVRVYLREYARVLEPGGNLYLTAYAEEGVPAVSVNPAGYLGRVWEGPRNCVRYEAGFLRSLIEEAGFEITRFEHAAGQFDQTLVAASLAPVPARSA